MAQFLKAKHSLKGKNLLPLALKLKTLDKPRNIARFEKNLETETMDVADIKDRLVTLMGDNPEEIIMLSGKAVDTTSYQLLAHVAIIMANEVGGPKTSTLQDRAATSTIAPPAKRTGEDNSINEPMAKVRVLEEELQKVKAKDAYETYKATLKEVRQIASSTHPIPVLLLLTLERLSDQASAVDTAKGEFYRRVYETVKKYEQDDAMGGLCLQLLGTPEDEKVASGLAKWLKHRKLEKAEQGSPNLQFKQATTTTQAPQGFYPIPQFGLNNFPMHGGWFGMAPGPVFPGFGMGHGGRPRAPTPRKPLRCYICGSLDHIRKQCPQNDKKFK